MDIDREDIVIALKWEDHKLFSKSVLDLLSDNIVDIGDFFI